MRNSTAFITTFLGITTLAILIIVLFQKRKAIRKEALLFVTTQQALSDAKIREKALEGADRVISYQMDLVSELIQNLRTSMTNFSTAIRELDSISKRILDYDYGAILKAVYPVIEPSHFPLLYSNFLNNAPIYSHKENLQAQRGNLQQALDSFRSKIGNFHEPKDPDNIVSVSRAVSKELVSDFPGMDLFQVIEARFGKDENEMEKFLKSAERLSLPTISVKPHDTDDAPDTLTAVALPPGTPQWAKRALGITTIHNPDAGTSVRIVTTEDKEFAILAKLKVGCSIPSLTFLDPSDGTYSTPDCGKEYLEKSEFVLYPAEAMIVPPDATDDQLRRLVARGYIANLISVSEKGFRLALPDESNEQLLGETFDETVKTLKDRYPIAVSIDTISRCYISYDGIDDWIQKCNQALSRRIDHSLREAIEALKVELKGLPR